MMIDILVKQFYSLIVFKTAVECGSFNRAASVLGMTQPAVTRNIARLESALGLRLLERHPHGVSPTEFGKTLIGYVSTASNAIEEGGHSLSTLYRLRKDAVACAGSTVTMMIVAAAVDRFSQRHDQQSLRLLEGFTPAMLDLLLTGELDFVVGSRTDEDIDERLVTEPLLDEELGVFASSQNILHDSDHLVMAELLQTASWVIPGLGTHHHAFIRNLLSKKGLGFPARLIESHSITAIRWMVQNTDRLSFATSLLHFPELLSGEVRALKTDWVFPVTKHTIYRRPRHLMSRAALDLIKEIKREAHAIRAKQVKLTR
jgi:DNA-binding transcriptional LysR family regulator